MIIFAPGLLLAIAVSITTSASAADIACEAGGTFDARDFPTTPGETVLNGRTDTNPSTCNIISLGNLNTISYPNGSQINSGGTGINFQLVQIDIANGLTVDDGGDGTGLVSYRGDRITEISGPISVINSAKLRFTTFNSGSSNTRLKLTDAYFNVDTNSELQVVYKLGDTTGQEFGIGAIQGDGDLKLTNTGSTTRHATIYLLNNDGLDYTFSGDIYYTDQNTPSLTKRGSGTFTFTGDVNNTAGDSIGFTDGFDYIDIIGGAFQTTTKSFVLGTKVQLEGGDLILNQDFDGTTGGAKISGPGNTIYKRGTGAVTIGNIGDQFAGSVAIEEGTLGLTGGSTLRITKQISIASGATLDVSQIGGTNTTLSRVSGNGTINLGTKSIGRVTSISPGDSIGTLNITGTGNTSLSGTLINIELDPAQGAGDAPGVTHDKLQIEGNVTAINSPLIKLIDVQLAASPSAFLNGREFTVISAAGGLGSISPLAIQEDLNTFHAFVGADQENTTITDTEVKVQFGIKTVQQVSTTVGTAPTGSGGSGSSKNKNNASQQYLQKVTGLTGNQAPTQAQLTTNPALQNLTTTNLARATSNNNPEAYSSNLTLGLEYADQIANMVMNHANGSGIAYQMANDLEPHEGRVWLDVAYLDGQVDGKSDETGDFDYILSSLVIGGDLLRKANYNLGLFAGTGRSDMDEHDHIEQDLKGDFFHVGAYHHYQMSNGYFLNSMVTLFQGDFDSKRQNYDTNGGYADASESDFKMRGGTIGVKLARHFRTNETTLITPAVGLSYTHINQDSIKESGGGAAYDYNIEEADARAVVLGIGLDFAKNLASSGRPIFLDMMLRYEYDAYADDNESHDIKAGLAGQESSNFVGQNRGAHGLLVGIGLESETAKNFTLGAGIVYAERSNGREAQINGNLTYFW